MSVDEQAIEKPRRGFDAGRAGRAARWIRAGRARWRVIVIVGLTAVAVGLAAGVYYFQYRPDQQIDATVAASAKKAAEDGTVAVLSYSPESLSDDIATAKSHLTGDFLNYYTHFTDQIFAAAAQQQQVTTTARVAAGGCLGFAPGFSRRAVVRRQGILE